MFKTIYAIVTAAIIAAAIVALPTLAPQVQAHVQVAGAAAKASGTVCSERGWPYYDASCLRDAGNGQARDVRVVSADRLTPLPATSGR